MSLVQLFDHVTVYSNIILPSTPVFLIISSFHVFQVKFSKHFWFVLIVLHVLLIFLHATALTILEKYSQVNIFQYTATVELRGSNYLLVPRFIPEPRKQISMELR
jgi:hypothetical protein